MNNAEDIRVIQRDILVLCLSVRHFLATITIIISLYCTRTEDLVFTFFISCMCMVVVWNIVSSQLLLRILINILHHEIF